MNHGKVLGFDEDQGGEAARVERTGIALVHEGGTGAPPAGSEAAATLVAHDDRVIVNYFFPVEIGSAGAGEVIDPQEIVAGCFAKLLKGVESVLL